MHSARSTVAGLRHHFRSTLTVPWLPTPMDRLISHSDLALNKLTKSAPTTTSNATRPTSTAPYGPLSNFRPVSTSPKMRLNVRHTKKTCAFFKADHEAAYKQLPMIPEHTKLTFVALRDPLTSRRMTFHPKVLLFGDTSAVLRYNCFARRSAVLFNRIFGIPSVGYFDDFGALSPGNVRRRGLRTFERSCITLGIALGKTKTGRGQRIIFLGLHGDFPTPASKILLSITPP